MHGNVDEMCTDWFGEYEHDFLSMEVTDPRGPITGEFKVTRGGSFVSPQVLCESANRGHVDPNEGGHWMVGFRAARDP
jgi:formylglycine-generating enzyme required for sulfatase activity